MQNNCQGDNEVNELEKTNHYILKAMKVPMSSFKKKNIRVLFHSNVSLRITVKKLYVAGFWWFQLLSCLSIRFIKGFIYRHKERCPENEYFLDYVRYSFLMNLCKNLPKNVLDKSWPTPPAALTEVRIQIWLKNVHVNVLSGKTFSYRKWVKIEASSQVMWNLCVSVGVWAFA